MRELLDIVRAYESLARAGTESVLATVVQTRGSTYRKAGARMLMTESEWLAGAISGGCLEGDLLRKAWWRTAAERAVLVTYDGALAGDGEDDEDGGEPGLRPVRWGFGLGCDGSIDVLIERLRPGASVAPLALLSQALRMKRRAVFSTVIRVLGAVPEDVRVGQRMVTIEGDAQVSDLSLPLAEKAAAQAEALLGERDVADDVRAVLVRYPFGDGAVEVVHEVVPPPRPLVIFGGNYDALPVARFAHALGWDVTLVERRPLLAASSAEFAQHARVVIGRAPEVVSRLALTPRTAVVVMTHNYDEDRALVQGLIAGPARYIGMLGPRRRTERILSELAAAGTPIDAAVRARIHGPVGLDLGARSPEEIALSIVAEVQAVTAARTARPLGDAAPASILKPAPDAHLMARPEPRDRVTA